MRDGPQVPEIADTGTAARRLDVDEKGVGSGDTPCRSQPFNDDNGRHGMTALAVRSR